MAQNEQHQLVTEQCCEFFHPNICHTCKMVEKLTECSLCHMIYYCSEHHKIEHEVEHQDICKAIVYLKMQGKLWNNYVMTSEAWVKFQKENIESVEQVLRRDLVVEEKQMFLFAKSCFVCHRQEGVYDFCKQCFSINVCSDHNLTDAAHACSQLHRALVLDRYNFDKTERERGIWKGYMSFDKHTILNMELFITQVIQRGRTKWTQHDYILTDDFSGPLTLCYMMNQAHLSQTGKLFVVHIVNNKMMDNRSLSAWELVLHEFCPGTTLIIVMVGPESHKDNCYIRNCLTCINESKGLVYEIHRMMYYSCDQRILHGPPDVIIMFDVELRYKKKSAEIIKACQRQHCPVLLTATSKIKADDNVMMIRKILNSSIHPLINEQNKFRSFKPYRNYENNSVFYPNEYLTFYRDLSDSSCSSQSSSTSGI